jgi:hypothetical protein
MAEINLLRKALPSLDRSNTLWLSQPRRSDSKGGKSASVDEQEPAAMTKRAGAKRHCPLAPAVPSPAVKAA